MKIFSPSDCLMGLVCTIPSLKMKPGQSTCEFVMVVLDDYRHFHAEAKRIWPPKVSFFSLSWEQSALRSYERGPPQDIEREFRKGDPPNSFSMAMSRAKGTLLVYGRCNRNIFLAHLSHHQLLPLRRLR